MMKKSYRIICLLLTLVMVLSTLVSCGGENTPPAEEPEEEEQGTAIVKKGVPQYTIVYASGLSGSCVDLIYRLQDKIYEAVGATVEVKKEGEQQDADAKEILIGATDYDESTAVTKTLSKTQYAIREEGNKIVVVAKNNYTLEEAIWCFIEQLIPRNVKEYNGKFSLYHEDFLVDYVEPTEPLFNGESLGKYAIVYSKDVPGMEDIALDLAKRLKGTLGLDLECYPDTFREEVEYEILIGRTNRPYSVACFSDGKVPLMSYRLIVEGTKIQFAAAGGYSMSEMASKFVSSYVLSIAMRNLRDGTYMESDLLPIRSQPLTAGSTLRVMTSNVLADAWVDGRDYPSVAARAEMYAATLLVYRPDLVGIQETDKPWINTLPYYLQYLRDEYSVDYDWIETAYRKDNGSTVPNYTSLIYRKDTFSLVESGSQEFSFTNQKNYKIRVATWAILTHKLSNEKYALINTHWDFTSEKGKVSVEEECRLIESFKQRYEGLHVFCTGDFNNHLNGSYELFKETGGLNDSKEVAAVNGTLINENAGIPEKIYIDHVAFNEGITVTRHETIEHAYASKMSDHLPQYGDFIVY